MGPTVDKAFETLDEALNLDPAQRRQAQARHNEIRDVLMRTGLVATTFLQGSFARKTMLKPLKDVDVVVVLKPELWRRLSGPDGPQTAMSWFRAAVANHWPDAEFDQGEAPSAKALRVSFPDLDFAIDLVPAFEVDSSADEGGVLIGDREERKWELSNTRRQTKVVSQRNKRTDGRFVHQVRELKSLVRHHDELEFVKGIVLEPLALAVICQERPDKYAVADVLEQASTAVQGPVLDPAGDDDVTAKWSRSERLTAVHTFAKLAEQAHEALALEADDDVDAAIDVWHRLIGVPFPPARNRSPIEVLGAWNTEGSRSSTGRPTTSTRGRQSTRPGRAWAPR
jgi:hypothetical protein